MRHELKIDDLLSGIGFAALRESFDYRNALWDLLVLYRIKCGGASPKEMRLNPEDYRIFRQSLAKNDNSFFVDELRFYGVLIMLDNSIPLKEVKIIRHDE